jgi:hypothetical protein
MPPGREGAAWIRVGVAHGHPMPSAPRGHNWVLAEDDESIERLDKGYAAGGILAVRSAIFEALLITTRMQ